MVVQHKEDIVCAFHGDIEKKLDELNIWMAKIDKKLNNLLMWKASVIGWSAGACAAVMLFFKLLKIA